MAITQTRVPGIIGGMGPQATVDFMAKLVALTPATTDQEHIRVLLDHNPQVPDRHSAIAGDGATVRQALTAMARGLEQAGADFLLMVCNTAHAFQSDIVSAVDIPFVSVVGEVVSVLDERWHRQEAVGVMAAEGALAAQLYQQALLAQGRVPVTWAPQELAKFMSLLYRIKAGAPVEEVRGPMEGLAQALVERGAQVLIAGCTEIPLVMPTATVPLLSSTDILVSRTLEYALGQRPLPTT